MQSSIQVSGAAFTSAYTKEMFHNRCRQCCDAMGDGECKAAAGVGHRSHLYHCPATATRGCLVLAGVQPDRPCPSEMCLIPAFVLCHFILFSPAKPVVHGKPQWLPA